MNKWLYSRPALMAIVLIIVGSLALVWLFIFNQDDDSTNAQTAPSELVAQGKIVYTTYCVACHGVDGVGQIPAAPLEKDSTGRFPAPPHNQDGHTWHHDDDLLVQIIQNGGVGDTANFYEMPAFGALLNNDQIEAVLAYIKTLWTDEQRQTQRQRTEFAREQNGE